MMKEPLQKIRGVFLLGMLMLFAESAHSAISIVQQDTARFTATITDENRSPLKNITVKVQRTGLKTISDADGIFSVGARKQDVLLMSLNDQALFKYTINDTDTTVIVIHSKNVVLRQNREVRLLFGVTANPNQTAASTDAVYSSDVTRMPVTSVSTALTGRLAGLYALQSSGQPGGDGSSLSLRGRSPLVIIDGVPRGLSIFNLEEIASVTVVKDALGNAMLGGKGFNGALLITTKRGSKANQMISFTAQTAFQKSLKVPQSLNAFNYATLYNEAAANDGLAQPYTQADLAAYQNHTDPYGHPDVNWIDQTIKPNTRMDQYSLNITGGNDWGKYFVSMQHINQIGFMQTSDENSYDTNNKFLSYVVRSNVDINLNKNLSAGVNLFGRILNGNEPGYGYAPLLYSYIQNTPANAYPVFNPDGTYGTSASYQTNVLGQAINSGYTSNYKRDVLADLFLKRTLNEITEGLWIRAAASLYSTISEDIYRTKSFASFAYNAQTGLYTQYGTNGTQGNSNAIAYQSRSDYMELKLGYDRTIGKNAISSVIFANRDNTVADSNLPYTLKGISGRAAYTYNEKYTAEFAMAYNGSNYYPPDGDYKFGFFPAAGLSWHIGREDFFPKNKVLNDLKLFTSYGKNGNDNPGYFSYIQRYYDGSGIYFGSSAGSNTSIFEQPIANANVSFEQAKKLNAGVQGTLFNSHLGFKAEYYNNKYYDLLMVRGKNSALLGQVYPNENIGEYTYRGWDFSLNWQQTLKNDLSYFLAFTGGLQESEVSYIDEVIQPYSWMKRTGQMVGQTFGYIADGLFQSQTEINNSPKYEGYTAHPGDIKYKDLNGDGLINQFDQTAIGATKPLFFYGLSLGFQWKAFDLNALVQGALNRKIYLSGATEWAFQNNGLGQAWEHNLDRWTPATAATAAYPRLTVGTNINNEATSTFWMKSGNYLRLKNIEIGYTVPKVITRKIRLQSLRVFASGTNLFTVSAYDRVDPEVYNMAYPIQRLINLGINIKL